MPLIYKLLSVIKAKLKFLIALILLVLVTYFVLINFSKNTPNSQLNTITVPTTQSVFKELTDNKYSLVLDEFNNVIFVNDYWLNWDSTKNMIAGDVIKLYPDSKEIYLNIFGPNDKEFSGRNRVVSKCSASSNVLVASKNLKVLKGNFDLFNEMKVGDLVYAYCLDEVCNNIGKACVLVSRSYK